jgi:hypothetical protein
MKLEQQNLSIYHNDFSLKLSISPHTVTCKVNRKIWLMYLSNLTLFCIILFHFQFLFHTLLSLLVFKLFSPLGLFPCTTVQQAATDPPYPVLCCCQLSNYTQGHVTHCITVPTTVRNSLLNVICYLRSY